MLRRLRISFKVRIKSLLIRFSVAHRHEYRRFIILSHPRSGSTLLHTYLNSHWQVHSYGELFTQQVQESFETGNRTVNAFYKARMLRSFPRMIRAVGFKFFYQYTETGWGNDLLKLLQADPELVVIHLKRRDSLRTAVSYALAKATGHWTYARNEAHVELDADEVGAIMKAQSKTEALLSALFMQHRVLQVSYEDLDDRPENELKRVQEFLGVPVKKLITTLKRQHEGGMERYVANYDQLSGLSDDQ